MVVLGVSGSGKTTLARRVASLLGERHIDMNALLEGPPTGIDARVDRAIAADGWVADASLEQYMRDRVLDRADLIVWLDLPLRIALARVWRRSRRQGEPALGLMLGAVRAHFSNRRRFPRRLERFERVVRLRSPGDVEAWLP